SELAIGVPEPAAVFQVQPLDPLDQAGGRFVCRDIAGVAGYGGLDVARVGQGHGKLAGRENQGQGFAGGIEGSLGHPVAVTAAGAVILDGTHATGDQRHLAAFFQVIQQAVGNPQRPERVHFELALDLLPIHVVQAFLAQQPCIVNQNINGPARELLLQGVQVVLVGDINSVDDFYTQCFQVGRLFPADADHLMSLLLVQLTELQSDTPVGTGYQYG